MKIDHYKESLSELSTEELTELLREVRLSRTKPKASNKKRKARAEGGTKKKKPMSKNQMLNFFNSLSAEEAAKLLSQMED